MEGFWAIFFLLVVLKIPVLGSLWLVWWATRATPETEDAPDEGHGDEFRRWDAEPRPRGPHRGPHGAGSRPLPECPPGGRTRILNPPAPARAGMAHARGAAEPDHAPGKTP